MQVQVVGEHFHTDVAIAIQVLGYTDTPVHGIPRVIHEVMDFIIPESQQPR